MNTTVLSASLAVWLMMPVAPMPRAEAMGRNRTESDSIERMSRYNVVWTSPSKDATGVMPIGNGDIAAGVYAIENGDLFLLLSKNDAFNYMGDLYKTGRLRVTLDPNPFRAGKPFRQTLDLPTGSIRIQADGTEIRIWAAANRPVYHIEIRSPRRVAVTARPELWKRFDHCDFNCVSTYSRGLIGTGEPPQDVPQRRAQRRAFSAAGRAGQQQ